MRIYLDEGSWQLSIGEQRHLQFWWFTDCFVLLTITHKHTFSLSLSLNLSFSLTIYHRYTLSFYLINSHTISLYLSFFLSFFLSLLLSLPIKCVWPPPLIQISLSFSLPFSDPFFHLSFSLPFSLSFFLSLSHPNILTPSHTLSHTTWSSHNAHKHTFLYIHTLPQCLTHIFFPSLPFSFPI